MHPSFFDELNRIWFDKVAADLTEAARAKLPKKDFAVPASKSNTGEKAYPIPDRQHARSALGFAKMHGDSADYARVRAKVEAKFPDMLKKGSEEKKEKTFFERNPNLGKFIRGNAAATGFALSNAGLAAGLAHLSRQSAGKPGAADILTRMRKASPTPVDDRFAMDAYGGGGFMPSARLIDDGSSPLSHVRISPDAAPEILAHELGHAEWNRNRVGRVTQGRAGQAFRVGAQASGLVGLGAGLLSDNPKVHAAATLAPIALYAPTLLNEAAASIKGIKHIRGAGGSLGGYAKMMAPAFGTYLASAGHAVGSNLASQGIGGGIRSLFHKKRSEPDQVKEGSGTLAGLGPVLNTAEHAAVPGGVKERLIGALANRFSHPMDLAGLGVLGLPAADQLQAHTRAGLSGKYNKEEVKKREVLPHVAHPLAELGGLGMIAAPVAAQMLRGQH